MTDKICKHCKRELKPFYLTNPSNGGFTTVKICSYCNATLEFFDYDENGNKLEVIEK